MPILIILFIIIMFKIALNIYFSKARKGLRGENKTIAYIKQITSVDRILHDVTITDISGNNAQIDIVVLDNTGIYVIEVKNFANNAKIYLTDSKEVKLYYKIKYKPSQEVMQYNPIWQNRTHIKCLSSYLNLPTNNFVSIVAIAGGEYIDYTTQRNAVTITYSYNIVSVLCSEISKRSCVFDEAELIKIRRALKPEIQAQIEHKAEQQKQQETRQAERRAKAEALKQKIADYVKKQSTAIKNMFNKKSE